MVNSRITIFDIVEVYTGPDSICHNQTSIKKHVAFEVSRDAPGRLFPKVVI